MGDDESTDVRWFPVDDLPQPRRSRLDAMVAVALADPRDVALDL